MVRLFPIMDGTQLHFTTPEIKYINSRMFQLPTGYLLQQCSTEIQVKLRTHSSEYKFHCNAFLFCLFMLQTIKQFLQKTCSTLAFTILAFLLWGPTFINLIAYLSVCSVFTQVLNSIPSIILKSSPVILLFR